MNKTPREAIGTLEVVCDEEDGSIGIAHPIFGKDNVISLNPKGAFDLGMALCSAAMVMNGGPFKMEAQA